MHARRRIAGPNVEFRGYVSDEDLRNLLQRARAVLFAAEEDFGILPVEAQACGTLVICYGRGGVLDTVVSGLTGIYFDSQPPSRSVTPSNGLKTPRLIAPQSRANAERFSVSAFRADSLPPSPCG